jgi:hypothetical protein
MWAVNFLFAFNRLSREALQNPSDTHRALISQWLFAGWGGEMAVDQSLPRLRLAIAQIFLASFD